jgi:hypothetical protein
MATYILTVLTVPAVWISSMNTNHQLLITSNVIRETFIPGIFTATLRASAAGYESESKTTFNLIEQDEDLEYNSNDIINDEEDLESIGYSSNELLSKYV